MAKLTTVEEKKKATATAPATTGQPAQAAQATAPSTPAVPAYESPYAAQIDKTMEQVLNRPAFEYNAADDQMWQQYLDKYQQGGKLAMKSSMGQAAALTGGYGSSYAQAVGQQTFDSYMQDAADILPTLEQQAWERYNTEGDRLTQQLGILQDKENTEYSRYVYDQEWAYQQEMANRENLQNMIASTGYTPTAEELAAAGMTEAEAQALKQGLVAGDPDYAYRMGLIDGEGYKAMTGVYPAGYVPPAAAGGGGGGYYEDSGRYSFDAGLLETQQAINRILGKDIAEDGLYGDETKGALEEFQNDPEGEKWLKENGYI